MRHLNIAIRLLVVSTILLGLVYPLLVTGIAQVLFPRQANGSLVSADGRIIGSELIGQRFVSGRYFHGRLSAAGKDGYDASASGASNLGPTSRALADRVGHDVERIMVENPSIAKGQIPADMVTASGSGLDPDISVPNAHAQAGRVAKERRMSVSSVDALIKSVAVGRQFGVLGEERVNVLKLNMLLDSKSRVAM